MQSPSSHFRHRDQQYNSRNCSTGAALPLRVPSVELALPSSMTHEGLAYAPCPICGVNYHMTAMELHLTTVHRELNPDHCRRICLGRLRLYEKVVGTALRAPDPVIAAVAAGSGSALASVSGSGPCKTATPTCARVPISSSYGIDHDSSSSGEIRHSPTPPIPARVQQALEQLPTITAQGAYQCNWCVHRSQRYSTRDAFLKHVLHVHSDIPLDDVEEHIPMPAKATALNSGSANQDYNMSNDNSRSGGAEGSGWGTATEMILSGERQQRQQGGRRTATRVVLKTSESELPASAVTIERPEWLPPLPARQVGITLPRGLDNGRAHGAVAHIAATETRSVSSNDSTTLPLTPEYTASTAFDASLLVFSEGQFPCELCGRVLGTELNLLQHLESKHPTGLADSPSRTTSAATAADVAKFMREEAGTSPAGICVLCDLCVSSKVYTLPSALYAHIRFKHPNEDAAFHVERMIEAGRDAQPARCPHCGKGFATEAALDGHMADKHADAKSVGSFTEGSRGIHSATSTHEDMVAIVGRSSTPSAATTSSATLSLPPVTVKNRWWCNACEKGFGQAKALHGHMIGKHQVETKTYPCPACKRIFADVHSLQDHFLAQHRAISLRDLGITTHVACPLCERLFLSNEDLDLHTARHHKGAMKAMKHATASTATLATAATKPAYAKTEAATTLPPVLEAPATPRKVARRRSGTAT